MVKSKCYYCYTLVSLLVVLPSMVASECTCEADDMIRDSKSRTLKYKLGAIGAILGSGAMGVGLPIVGKRISVLRPENDIFFMIKAFAAGVILATGFIHILPEAFEGLTSPCIGQTPWQNFPFAAFIAMVASIGCLMVDSLATGHYTRIHFGAKNNNNEKNITDVGSSINNNNNKVGDEESAQFRDDFTKLDLIRHRVTAQVLELGIVVHSVIIGISLGTSERLDTIKPLMAALCFHQFFEGMGLGGCITQAKFKSRAMATMALFFSLTTPIGIGIGIAICGVYDESSPRSLIIQGIFEAAAAGILIYMALVDLLAADFMNPRMQANTRIQLGSHLSLLLGAACMSVLAKWA
ncbi:Zinc transporter 1 [Bienertia sinuspersici]